MFSRAVIGTNAPMTKNVNIKHDILVSRENIFLSIGFFCHILIHDIITAQFIFIGNCSSSKEISSTQIDEYPISSEVFIKTRNYNIL